MSDHIIRWWPKSQVTMSIVAMDEVYDALRVENAKRLDQVVSLERAFVEMKVERNRFAHANREQAEELAVLRAERDALRERLAEAERTNAEWLKANGPGGWIDVQRKRLAEIKALLRHTRQFIDDPDIDAFLTAEDLENERV